jgi:acyl-CoA thioester hydrolase
MRKPLYEGYLAYNNTMMGILPEAWSFLTIFETFPNCGLYAELMPTLQKIRYSDCDPQGIVFNGNYARYWDDAATDWLEAAGFSGAELGGIGVEVVTARLEIDFKNTAKLGETLVTTVAVENIGNTSMTVGVRTERQSDGLVVALGRLIWVFVDPVGFRPVPVPDSVEQVLR